MGRRIAILDLGTNTFHLLIVEVADDSIEYVYKEKIPVKIGQGGISKGHITNAAKERALNALKYFRNLLDRQGIEEIYANATSAFRNAKNGKEIVDLIYKETGLEINIISGDKEAELIYQGVKKALNLGKENTLIIDIGGGSVEFIICNNDEILWKESFEIGAQRLLDRFHQHEPILSEETAAIELYFEEQLESLKQAVKKFPVTSLTGSSGAFDTFADICRFKHNLVRLPYQTEYQLPIECYLQIHKDLIRKDKNERLQIPGMLEMRVDMIVVSSLLVHFVLKKFRIPKIRVSSYSMKEGILADILTRIEVNS